MKKRILIKITTSIIAFAMIGTAMPVSSPVLPQLSQIAAPTEALSVSESQISVLEVQPDEGYTLLTAATVRSWLGDDNANVTITSMSVYEFIGKQENLIDTYSIIYIGGDSSGMNLNGLGETVYTDVEMNGLIYSNVGDIFIASATQRLYTATVFNNGSNSTGTLNLRTEVRSSLNNANVTDAAYLSYQWQRRVKDANGVPVGEFINIIGATNSIFTSFNDLNSAQYRCVVTHSGAGTLTPTVPRTFFTGVVDWNVTLGYQVENSFLQNFTVSGDVSRLGSASNIPTVVLDSEGRLTLTILAGHNLQQGGNESTVARRVEVFRAENGQPTGPDLLAGTGFVQGLGTNGSGAIDLTTRVPLPGTDVYYIVFTIWRPNSFSVTAQGLFSVSSTVISTAYTVIGGGGSGTPLTVSYDAVAYRYSGNDITRIKMQELREFSQAGNPLIIGSELINNEIIEVKRVDTASYMYDFLSGIIGTSNVYTSDTAVNVSASPKSGGHPVPPEYDLPNVIRILQIAPSDYLAAEPYKSLIEDITDKEIRINTVSSLAGVNLGAYNLVLLSNADTYDALKITIDEYIRSGGAVLFTGGVINPINRDTVNLNRYGTGTGNTAFKPSSGRAATVPQTQGYGNYNLKNTTAASSVTQVNPGRISTYPYNIGTLPVSVQASSTIPPYQLNMNADGVTVWYCLNGVNYLTNDVTNAYYIYNVGNVTYSGINLSAVPSETEAMLFVNTLFAASRQSDAVTVSFTDSTGIIENMQYILLPSNTDDGGILNGESLRVYFKLSDNSRITDVSFTYGSISLSSGYVYNSSSDSWYFYLDSAALEELLENASEVTVQGTAGGDTIDIKVRRIGLFNLH
ncbi:MAG: DUF5057 domain-containing protein [Oscillospiraceae bacterium]|nr:DUF5057 domain-containing protein [Oscillospiraceae bacterium]